MSEKQGTFRRREVARYYSPRRLKRQCKAWGKAMGNGTGWFRPPEPFYSHFNQPPEVTENSGTCACLAPTPQRESNGKTVREKQWKASERWRLVCGKEILMLLDASQRKAGTEAGLWCTSTESCNCAEWVDFFKKFCKTRTLGRSPATVLTGEFGTQV